MSDKPFNFSDFEMSGSPGMDALFAREPAIIAKKVAASRRKVGSLGDLSEFIRVSAETLIHKSQRELWALKQGDGGFYVERLFDDNGEPLKG